MPISLRSWRNPLVQPVLSRITVSLCAALAVPREPGQAINVGHRDTGPLQRLDQRIGEPLRELVDRHEAVRRIGALDRRMPPGVAERYAAERQPTWPDRTEMLKQRFQD